MASFIKKKEDFICEKCGLSVVGTGYTNHCSQCLWSKHVDNGPGDRASKCLGMMKPVRIEGSVDHYVITHKCLKCGHEKKNKADDGDNIDALTKVIAQYSNL